MLHLVRAIFTSRTALEKAIEDGKLFYLPDEQYLEIIQKAFGKELGRLKDAPLPIESAGKDPPVGVLRGSATPSRLLFGGDYHEINRTLVSTLALKWIMEGEYTKFTHCQLPVIKLKEESFEKLRIFFTKDPSVVAETRDILTLLVAIVVNDLGKDPSLADEVSKATGKKMLSKQNHDEVIFAAEEHGAQLVPSLRLLDTKGREHLHLGLKLGSKLNPAQFAQAECVPGSLKGVLDMKGNERAFTIKFMELLLDVAGAQGHVDATCAKVMTEPVYQGYMNTYDALSDIVAGRASPRKAYDQVLTKRGEMLAQQGFRELTVKEDSDRALLRLLLMSRTDNKAQADIFQEAFDEIPSGERQILIDGLNVDGLNDGRAILPYYMPACFAEGLKNTDGSREGKKKAITALMRFLGRVVEGTKPGLGSDEVVERDLSFASVVIKGETFKKDPQGALERLKLPWLKN